MSTRTSSLLPTPAELRDVQCKMAAALMQPLTRTDRLRRKTSVDFIKPNDRLSGFERLEIYARQYWFRLLDCLCDDYPALRAHMGEKQFHKLCREYLATHPSTSWTLRNLGSHLPSFIQEPKARDIARVEWGQTLAFDEPLMKAIQMDDLLGSDPSTLKLKLQACVIPLRLDYAVDHFITAMKKSDAEVRSGASQAMSEAPTRREITKRPRLMAEMVHLVIHRHDNTLYFKRLQPEAFVMLTALGDGATLANAIESALAQASPEIDWSTEIRNWFNEWSQLGWFCRPETTPNTSKP
jgi:hypothetical protein